jgi:Spy/CpxP family protein refolding chaperone
MRMRLITLGGIALVLTALTLPAFARGPGWGGGPYARGGGWGGGPGINCPNYGGAWGQNLTDEQKGQLDNLYKKFFDDTAQLRNQIWTKRGELQTLLSSPNPDPGKAKALQKELSDLKAKMAQERLTLQMEELKINPDARFGGRHFGPRGYSRGMGYGRGGCFGPGSCWN